MKDGSNEQGDRMKKYILKRDLPTFKAGDIFIISPDGCLWHSTGGEHADIMAYHRRTLEAFPEMLTEWFTEIKGHAPLEGSLDYDLFVIDSQNADTTQEQLRDSMKDALEQIISRLNKLEEDK